MTIRFYLLPIETNGVYRGPKYFTWRFDPNPPGLPDRWSWIYYGAADRAVLVSDITDTNHDNLTTHADVYAFPIDIDTTMTQTQQNTLNSFLESYAVPGSWLTGTQTFRSVLRTIAALFLFMQNVSARYGSNPLAAGITLNTQWRNIPTELRTAIYDAAVERGFTGNVANNTTVRNLLKSFADLWGARPIYIGFAEL